MNLCYKGKNIMKTDIDCYTRKFAYATLRLSELLINSIVWGYAIFYKSKSKSKSKISSIGAFWYYPEDITGSNLRFGKWKPYFEKEGVAFKNFHINKFSEYVLNVEKGNWTKKYLFFTKCLWRRFPQLIKSHNYDCIWIDRGLIPFYPRQNAFIERQIKKVCSRLIVDTTDGGDYQGNPKLMEDVLNTADEITVGYKYLKEFYEVNFKVNQIFWTIPKDGYVLEKVRKNTTKLIVGWMGSPSNFKQVLSIVEELRSVHDETPFIFRYICRENFDDKLIGLDCEHHYFSEEYHDIIASFDIGICPFLTKDLRSQGKIAMKHQEFLLMGTPQVCSPVAISEFVRHNEHVLIAKNSDDWIDFLKLLLSDSFKREIFSTSSKALFNQYYTYESQYEKLKNVLVK